MKAGLAKQFLSTRCWIDERIVA